MSQHRESRKRIAVAKIYNKTLTVKSLAEHEHMQKHRAELGSLYKLWIIISGEMWIYVHDRHTFALSNAQTQRHVLAMHACENISRFFFFFFAMFKLSLWACTRLCVCSLPVFYAWFYVYMCTIRSPFYGRKYYIAKYFVCSSVAQLRHILCRYVRCKWSEDVLECAHWPYVLVYEIPAFTIKNLYYTIK